MPLAQHLALAIPRTEPDNDVACLSAVLTPPSAKVPSVPVHPFSLDDASALEPEPELPVSSFRLQILHSWIAARGGRPAEAPGHA